MNFVIIDAKVCSICFWKDKMSLNIEFKFIEEMIGDMEMYLVQK